MADPGFPRRGPAPEGGANLLFHKCFAKNCMRMKEIGPRGRQTCLAILWDPLTRYRSGTLNSNTVNSKFHLIRSFFEIFARFLSFHGLNARLIRTRLIQSYTNSINIHFTFYFIFPISADSNPQECGPRITICLTGERVAFCVCVLFLWCANRIISWSICKADTVWNYKRVFWVWYNFVLKCLSKATGILYDQSTITLRLSFQSESSVSGTKLRDN